MTASREKRPAPLRVGLHAMSQDTLPPTQEATPQEQVAPCAPDLVVTCLEATPSALWIGTARGLWLLHAPNTAAIPIVGRELVTSIASTGSTVYFSTWMGGGIYAVSRLTLRPEQIGYPDIASYNRGLIRMNAVALWNNTLAVATDGGLFSYSLSRRAWSAPHAAEAFRYLLATPTRLWAFGEREAVSFDRAYRATARVAVRVPMTPVLEQSALWWAELGATGVRVWRLSSAGRERRAIDFRFDEMALRLGVRGEPTAVARWNEFWYVGMGTPPLDNPTARRSGMLLRLNFATRRAELVWHGASVGALAPWRGALMVGTRDGLFELRRAEAGIPRP